MDRKTFLFVGGTSLIGGLLAACSSDDNKTGGSGGTGGKNTGGTGTGGTGTGGSSSGGASNGGSGGTTSGGATSGGNTSSGGTTNGGATSGGNPNAGGAGTNMGGAAGSTNSVTMCEATMFSGHQGHELTVPLADAMAGSEKTYSIQGSSGHDHMVTIGAADFAKLLKGETVIVTSSMDNSHTHDVTIKCT